MNVKLGIIGTGRIAGRFVKETEYVDGITAACVYNPHTESASSFSERCGIRNFTDDFDQLMSQVDAVYIASPHGTHFAYIKQALACGKHVLCEKPMCLKKAEAEEVFAYAGSQGLILFEGIKTAYCPGFDKLLDVARSGVIGEIRNVEACFTKLEDPKSRELTDLAYGGSFTELGSYVLLPAIKLFGTEYQELRFDSVKAANGLDLFTRATLTYPQGMATLTCGLGVKSEGRLLVCGTKGYLGVEAPWWKTGHFEAHFEDASIIKEYYNEFSGDGLRYELQAFVDAISRKETSSAGLSAHESIAFSSAMEAFLSSSDR